MSFEEPNQNIYAIEEEFQFAQPKKSKKPKVMPTPRVQAQRHAKMNPISKRVEAQAPPQNSLAVNCLPLPLNIVVDPYFQIKVNENQNNDAIVCDVCLEDDDYENDEIVICELCNAATHQTCYGGEIFDRLPLPDQPWFCARCQVLLGNKLKCNEIKCVMCPDLKGIMKPIGNNQWAHVICVNWTPEIWFTNERNEALGGTMNKDRTKLTCGRCHKVNGSCIQCDFKDCRKSWHVRCAAQGKILKPWN